jgi:hypothetical protein
LPTAPSLYTTLWGKVNPYFSTEKYLKKNTREQASDILNFLVILKVFKESIFKVLLSILEQQQEQTERRKQKRFLAKKPEIF